MALGATASPPAARPSPDGPHGRSETYDHVTQRVRRGIAPQFNQRADRARHRVCRPPPFIYAESQSVCCDQVELLADGTPRQAAMSPSSPPTGLRPLSSTHDRSTMNAALSAAEGLHTLLRPNSHVRIA